ncbi:hypothetical protein LEP1GSC158_5139 [Leptospira interrogans serovar Zanoni str. LT2156]|uniref:Uncharacterized protein n=1 Tax=Leptospira interrogans serovar Zanoni str. LT2156 TaxID=1001601 RepID=M6HEZ0_LEPIR|nr:hypothetical protein LEP1GSC158_5139 [Leptospira interrogans serovar Zanoni str. LT2156]
MHSDVNTNIKKEMNVKKTFWSFKTFLHPVSFCRILYVFGIIMNLCYRI